MVELLIVFSIIILLVGIISSTFISFRKSQTLAYDTETVVSLLRQARAQTLSSKNLTVYGVHLAAPQAVLFTGSIYSSSDPLNEVFNLSSTDTILLISLTGGGNDVVFQRLTGETSQSGTIVISNPGLSQTKTVTIYKTGLIDSQ